MKSLKDLCWNVCYSTASIMTQKETECADNGKLFKVGKTKSWLQGLTEGS